MTCGRRTNHNEVTVPLFQVPVGEQFRIIGTRGVVEGHVGDEVDVRMRVQGTDKWDRGRWLGLTNVKREVV